MCEMVVENEPSMLKYVPDHFKTQSLCEKAVEDASLALEFGPDHFKTQKMCDKAVRDDSSSLQYVPDWFVTQQQMDVWYDDDYCYHDDEIIEWYDGYKKPKAQKASIKEEPLQNICLL